MRVRDCMTSPVHVIEAEAPAWEAVGLMRRHQIRRLPVVDGKALVGIVSWTDLVRVQPRAMNGGWQVPTLSVGVQVRDLMTPTPMTADPEMPLDRAAGLMRRHKVGGLPVVEDGRLVGIVTESDLFDVFAEALGTGPNEVRLRVAVGSVIVELPRIVAGLARARVPIVSLQSLRFRGVEGIDLVVWDRDVRRAREALRRLTLEVSPQDEPVRAREE